MSVIKENDKQVSVYFDSLLELMDFNPPEVNAKRFNAFIGNDPTHHEYRPYGHGWFGPTNLNTKEVINHALIGDETLYENLQRKIVDLNKAVGAYTTDYVQNINKIQRKKIRAEFGDEIDIHKVYQGQCSTAWTRTKRVEVDVKHHLVTILVDYVASCNESATESLWRAAVTVKLVDDLLKAGKSVKVICGSLSNGSMYGTNKKLATTLVIKNYNEGLSLARLAAMTNVGFYRAAGFAMKHAQHRKTVEHLGYPSTLNDKNLPIHLQEEVDAGHTKFVPVGRISSLSAAVAGLRASYDIMKSFSQ